MLGNNNHVLDKGRNGWRSSEMQLQLACRRGNDNYSSLALIVLGGRHSAPISAQMLISTGA